MSTLWCLNRPTLVMVTATVTREPAVIFLLLKSSTTGGAEIQGMSAQAFHINYLYCRYTVGSVWDTWHMYTVQSLLPADLALDTSCIDETPKDTLTV